MLADFRAAQDARKECDRQSAALKKTEDRLREQIVSELQQMQVTAAKRGTFRAVLIECSGRVSWKTEFERVAGADAVRAAEAAVPSTTRLEVQPA